MFTRLLTIKYSYYVGQRLDHRAESQRDKSSSAELILRNTGGIISTWIISVQWHASAPLDFALVWAASPCIWPRSDICQIPYSQSQFPSPAVIKALANLHGSLAVHTSGQCRNLDEGTLESSSLLGHSQPGFTGRLTFERGLNECSSRKGSASQMLACSCWILNH